MSSQPERKEKDCLNCGEIVTGRYCQNCGQENIVTRQGFWSLFTHFIFDIFHFDGKFFDTLKTLFAKPGRVAREFIAGKRTKYLDPIRMYLFTSAVFFLIFFTVTNNNTEYTIGYNGFLSKAKRLDAIMELNARNLKDSLKPIEKVALKALLDSTSAVLFSTKKPIRADSIITLKGKEYKFYSVPESTRHQKPDSSDSWFTRMLYKKVNRIDQKYKDNPEQGYNEWGWSIFHRLPYMLFLSLPFFALILKLIYIRKHQFYYTDHIIFTLYHYIFSFLLMLLLVGFVELYQWLNLKIFLWLLAAGILFWIFYLYKGMRNFYGQSRILTLGKFILLNVLGFVIFIFLAVVFTLFSILQF